MKEVSWHVQWWRVRPQRFRCCECNRLRWREWAASLLPRRVTYEPSDAMSVVYHWQLLLGPLVVARWVAAHERLDRIEAHNAYVRNVVRLPLGL